MGRRGGVYKIKSCDILRKVFTIVIINYKQEELMKTITNSLDEFGTAIEAAPTKQQAKAPSPPIDLDDLFNDGNSNGNENEKSLLGNSQWALKESGHYAAVPSTKKELPAGVYTIILRNGTPIFVKQNLVVDDLMKFPDSLADKVLAEIEEFWGRGDRFKEYGFLHRRGYLFYGPQGSGKTAIVQQIVKSIIDRGGVVFICEHPAILTLGSAIFRQVEADRPIVCLFEDIDSIIDNYGEDHLLTFLDGENQINKVLNIATTNYPENLDKRIVSRPRRFDRVLKVGMPSAEIRKLYFKEKLKIKEEELDMWVDETDEFSFAACAELVISVKCLGHTFEEAVEILRELINQKVSSRDFDGNQVGFNTKSNISSNI